MKVAHVLPLSVNLYGQKEKDIGDKVRFFFTNLCEFEARQGLKVIAYMISSSAEFSIKICKGYQVEFVPVDIEPMLDQHKFGHQFSFRLILRVLVQRPDVVHFHGFLQHHLMYSILTIMSKSLHIKVVAHHQGIVKKSLIEKVATAIANRMVDRIIVTNLDTQKMLSFNSSISESRVAYIPNGVDPEIFYPIDKKRAKLKLGINVDTFVVLWVGRLSRPQKNAFVLIDAMSKIKLDKIPHMLIIVGQGEDENTLKKFAEYRSNSIGYNVSFITSFVKHEDLRIYYNAADVFVLNSSHEGMPQVAIEAMACGTPVVLSDVAGNRELAQDAGLLFPHDNTDALKECIESLAKNVTLRSSLSEKGYRKINRSFTWDKITKLIIETIYKKS